MRQSKLSRELQESVSNERLRPYLKVSPEGDQAQAFALYLWNLRLSESLYPSLQGTEIALRNSIHQAACEAFGDDFWFRTKLIEREKATVLRLDTILRTGTRGISPGRYVAEFPFGFWVGLFRGDYEQVLWTRMLPSVFPFAPRRFRRRDELHSRLDRIRRLRNRVFHYEPIWHLPDLPEQHRLILETIGWISPAMLEMTLLLDRFDSVYTRGSQPYAAELETIAQNWGA